MKLWDRKNKVIINNLRGFKFKDGKIFTQRVGGLFNGSKPIWCETDQYIILATGGENNT